MKTCRKCGIEKPSSEFSKHKQCRDGLTAQCRTCRYVVFKAWKAKNPQKAARSLIGGAIKKYGITVDQYLELVALQGGRCAICGSAAGKGRGSRLSVDHDHRTNKVRGLLCGNCNFGIGHFQDNADLLTAAASYVRRHV